MRSKKNSDIVTLTAAGSDNSFLLDYANSSDLGNDTSGYNNDFTATSMDADNQTGSSPSSAFATWNPLRVNTQTQTFAEGNLRFSSTQTSTNPAATGNYGVSSGKWYWEVDPQDRYAGTPQYGIATEEINNETEVGSNLDGVKLMLMQVVTEQQYTEQEHYTVQLMGGQVIIFGGLL